MLVRQARADMDFSAALVPFVMVATVVLLPLMAPLLMKGLTVSAWSLAKPLLLLVLLPLVVCAAIRVYAAPAADRLFPVVKRLAGLSTVLMLGFTLVFYFREFLRTVGSFAIGAEVLFVLGHRARVLSLRLRAETGTAQRHGAGDVYPECRRMFAVFTAFPNQDPRILVMILLSGRCRRSSRFPWRASSPPERAALGCRKRPHAVNEPSGVFALDPLAPSVRRAPGLKLADVPREVSAGVTLAALMIPLNIGYAQVAGLPPAAGLYAAIIPLVVFALLASSRHLVTSPDASMAGLVGAALVAFAAPGDPMRLQYALALALLCGALFFVFWIFRLAFLANFLSRAVMAGFITGLGIEVFTNQVRKILAAPHVAGRGVGRARGGGTPQGDHGELRGDRGLLRRGHRARPLHPPREPLLGGDRRRRLPDRPADETVCAEDPRGAGGAGPADGPRRAASTSPARGSGSSGTRSPRASRR